MRIVTDVSIKMLNQCSQNFAYSEFWWITLFFANALTIIRVHVIIITKKGVYTTNS